MLNYYNMFVYSTWTSGYDTTETYVNKRLYKKRIQTLKLRTVWYPTAMKENIYVLVFINVSFIFFSVYFSFSEIYFVYLFVFIFLRSGVLDWFKHAITFFFKIIIINVLKFWKLTHAINYGTFNYCLILYSLIWFFT